jgi:hypothetical protein
MVSERLPISILRQEIQQADAVATDVDPTTAPPRKHFPAIRAMRITLGYMV